MWWFFWGPGAGFEKWWLVSTVEMQYRTYVTVVKGVLLHSTNSIIVLAVALFDIPYNSTQTSYKCKQPRTPVHYMLASIFIFRTIVTLWFRHRESHLTEKNIRSSTFKTNDDSRTQLPPWRTATVEYRMSHSPAFQMSIPNVQSRREPQSGVRKITFMIPTLFSLFLAKIKSRYKTNI